MSIFFPSTEEILQDVFKFTSFRPGQQAAIETLLAGENLLVILPTGGGKSLCYQIPALLSPHTLTVVISPLIALMRDQVLKLQRLGIPAAALHSLNTPQENAAICMRVRARKIRLLYLSPERFVQEETRALLQQGGLKLVAIDEAHCISQWGHHFRPDYLRLSDMLAQLNYPQTLALTATADLRTREEIIAHLFNRAPVVQVGSFHRPNLYLSFQPKRNGMLQMIQFVRRHKRKAGIIYVSSRRRAMQFAQALRADGHDAHAYHAGLTQQDRAVAQDAFLTHQHPVIVATIAFGLGIDRPDVRFVGHLDMPSSIETYYQEIGRAGRDGLRAEGLTLYCDADADWRRQQIDKNDGAPAQKALEHQKLDRFLELCHSDQCRTQQILSELDGLTKPKCNHCDRCGRSWIQLIPLIRHWHKRWR